MSKTHKMVRLMQVTSVLFAFFGCLMIFIYTPFYSKLIVATLNTFVPVDVNEVAAQSQKMAALSEQESLEPGSDLWIARQAYLQLMEEQIKEHNSQNLTTIQARYKALQQLIMSEQREEQEKEQKPQIPLVVETASSEVDPTENVKELLELNSKENKALMEHYLDFLKTHKVETVEEEPIDEQIYQDIAQIHAQNEERKAALNMPNAIVVLGGGLTLDKNRKDIVVNEYTRLRLETTLQVEQQFKLPIVLSGVEAPYMQKWLKARGVDAKLLEDRSMNTCENSRFSSLLLQKKGGAPRVILITDQYHMPRTRRLFALNGIETQPIEAPMPTQLTQWRPSEQNYDHSRRANYEMLATIRDVLLGSSDCREIP